MSGAGAVASWRNHSRPVANKLSKITALAFKFQVSRSGQSRTRRARTELEAGREGQTVFAVQGHGQSSAHGQSKPAMIALVRDSR